MISTFSSILPPVKRGKMFHLVLIHFINLVEFQELLNPAKTKLNYTQRIFYDKAAMLY